MSLKLGFLMLTLTLAFYSGARFINIIPMRFLIKLRCSEHKEDFLSRKDRKALKRVTFDAVLMSICYTVCVVLITVLLISILN